MPGAAFQTAYASASKLKAKPTNDEQLQLYAYGKIANGEEPKKPGMIDLAGKAKYKKWEEFKKEGITPEQAEEKYIALLEELKTKYGFEA